MINELIEKRNSFIAEYDALKAKLSTEKRSAYNPDELTRVNEIKIEIENLDKQIEVEKDLTEKRNKKLDFVTVNTPSINSDKFENDFVSFLKEGRSGKFHIPFSEIEKRSTITTSSNSSFKFTDSQGLSLIDDDLVLGKAGVKTWYFTEGAVDMPSMSGLIGTFGTEDNSVSDASLTTAKKTLTPTFVSASLEVSKVFLKTAKAETINGMIAAMKHAIDKGLEKRTIDTFSNLTSTTGVTASTTMFNTVVKMEEALIGTPSAYILSSKGMSRAKLAKKDSGSGEFVYSNGSINGYPAYRSTIQTNILHGYLVSAGAVAQAYWGDGITVEYITDATISRKGNVLILVSALADGSYIDANGVTVFKNLNSLS